MLYRGNRIIFTLLLVLTTMLAQAQSVYTIVEFLDEDAATAVFFAEGRGTNEKNALEDARVNVMRKIIYDGVEGFNEGKPLFRNSSSSGQNIWLKNLFNEKNATYKNFLGGIELVGDFDRDGSTYICKANVVIKHSFLKRQVDMQANGHNMAPTSNENQQQREISHRWSVN